MKTNEFDLRNPIGLFKRDENNPLLTAKHWPYPVNAVFNTGATKFNNETLLLVRVEDMTGLSHLTVAKSKDGITDWKIDTKPTFNPDPHTYFEELWGIEDPRIVYLNELEKYAITYTGYTKGGPLVCLAFTSDFENFERCGAILPPDNKDSAIIPKRINGKWMLIHRPSVPGTNSQSHIWLASSPDLLHWGSHQLIMEARSGGWWDSSKIGLGPQPIETPEGWLIIYHGVKKTVAGPIYRLGLALLDLDEPQKVIRRSRHWVFGPTEDYERHGDVSDVTFPNGVVVNEKTGDLFMYYGGADMCVALATTKVNYLLEFLKYDCE